MKVGPPKTRREAKEPEDKLEMMRVVMKHHEAVQGRFGNLAQRVEQRGTETAASLEKVEARFEDINEKLEYEREKAPERFEQLEERIARLEKGDVSGGGAGPAALRSRSQISPVTSWRASSYRRLRRCLGVDEIYARSRRPTVLFPRLRDVTRKASALRQARIESEGKSMRANRDRTTAERERARPAGRRIARLCVRRATCTRRTKRRTRTRRGDGD